VLVVGLGAIGRRHVRNLRTLGCDIAVLRGTSAAASEARREFGIAAFDNPDEAGAWAPQFVLVANATSGHLSAARWAVEHGCHVFVEKPLAHSLEGIEEFLRFANTRQCCVGVGCNLRFHPALEAIRNTLGDDRIGRLLTARCEVGSYLPEWHRGSDYGIEYSARQELGGGALLTLIHELDFMIWIAGPVREAVGRRARVSQLEIDVEDVVELICRHERGALTSVHMDFVDRVYNRRSRWVGEQGSIEWQWGSPVMLLRPGDLRETLWDDPAFDFNETYVREIVDFLEAAISGGAPRTTGRDAQRVLETALSVRAV
jgi:predicted dehydrogenase